VYLILHHVNILSVAERDKISDKGRICKGISRSWVTVVMVMACPAMAMFRSHHKSFRFLYVDNVSMQGS
jgi:hypothetical protein